MEGTSKAAFALNIIASVLTMVNGHAYMLEPTARSALHQNDAIRKTFKLSTWGDCEYNNQNNLNGPWNCAPNGVNCGNRGDGVGIGQDLEFSNCGPCGDKLSDPRPRENEHGGKFDKDIIIANYIEGQIIHVRAIVTNPHNGWMQWRLCVIANKTVDVNGTWTDESKECFDKHLLLRLDGTDRLHVPISYRPDGTNWDTDDLMHNPDGPVYVQLPKGVYGERCVIQYTYRAGRGVDLEETFRGCADVSIRPKDQT